MKDAFAVCAGDQACSPRGRCEAVSAQQQSADAQATLDQALSADPAVVNTPQTVYHVTREREVTLTLQFSTSAPAGGLLYRVERSDDPAAAAKVMRAAGGDKSVDIKIAVGRANPQLEDSAQVMLKVFTELGNYKLALVPQYAVGGSYAGTATLADFGTTGLPIEFQIVTEPDGVSLSEAEHAWLLLPVSPAHLFSPISSGDETVKYVARALEYDEFVEKWVAKFEYAFDLTQSPVVMAAEATQVRRAMRFQVETLGQDALIGEFSDTWTGLYEARSVSGVRSLKEVRFEGELYLERFGACPGIKEIEVVEYAAAAPQPLDAPPLEQCEDADFGVAPRTEGALQFHCQDITSVDDFEVATPELQASCALAVSHAALAGETTGGLIRAFLDGEPVRDGQSFAEFMEDCAAGTDGVCCPRPAVLCGRQRVAYAYRNQGEESQLMTELVDQYDKVTREAYLGQELGAFGTDANLRLEWLKSSDFPAVIVSAVKSLNEQLLNDWKEKVLEVHLQVLQGQFDPSGLAVLSRQVLGAEAAELREQILTDMTQSWRGAMDSLTLATTRWHTLLQGDVERAQKRDYVSARAFELYLAAGVLKSLNQAAGAGYLSARLAGGFSGLVRELGKLSQPFDKLIYARDAEVVVNTSVDPASGNDTLLGERKADALLEIDRAHQSVLSVLEHAQAEALNEAQLRDRMANEINDLRDNLVELCGMPDGCSPSDFRSDPRCQVRVEAGQCGFSIDKASEEITAFGPTTQSVRYSSDDTVGSLMSRDPNILAATFFIDLSDFANLGLTCNAKVATLAVNLVGDVGQARPTVRVLYDGTSKLRSCQPGIEQYVSLFGPDTTNYGKITHLRTAGRSMSPVAAINGFASDSGLASQSLGGLPLASQYTLLINTQVGENRKIDWSRLEDIEFKLTYSYQDIFPVGQCDSGPTRRGKRQSARWCMKRNNCRQGLS